MHNSIFNSIIYQCLPSFLPSLLLSLTSFLLLHSFLPFLIFPSFLLSFFPSCHHFLSSSFLSSFFFLLPSCSLYLSLTLCLPPSIYLILSLSFPVFLFLLALVHQIRRNDYDCVTCLHPLVVVHDCKLRVDGISKYLGAYVRPCKMI